jgi:hypothetical protein
MAVTRNEEGRVDIAAELPPELAELLKQPRCLDIGLPEPGSATLTLPFGGARLKGVADATRGIPTDCSLNISLLLQLGPIVANLHCLIQVLKLIEPLIEIVKGLPFPPVEAITKFVEASSGVLGCIAALTTPTGICQFVRDILLLIIRILNCLIDQMKSLIGILGPISLQLQAADGNAALEASLACAQQNAERSMAAAYSSIEPVMLVLELVGPLLEIAQVGPIEIPALAPPEDVEQMEQVVQTLEEFVATLQLVADALEACG